jgi:hypothetical protein
VSDTPALAVVGSAGPDRWPAALESAVRAEFLGSPLIPPTGSPLLAKCGVEACCRPAQRTAWDGVDTRLCGTHGLRWEKAGRPPKDVWLSAQPPGSPSEAMSARPAARRRRMLGLVLDPITDLADLPDTHSWLLGPTPLRDGLARILRDVGVPRPVMPGRRRARQRRVRRAVRPPRAASPGTDAASKRRRQS